MNVAKRVLRWWRDLREDGRIYRRHCARTGSDGYAIYLEAMQQYYGDPITITETFTVAPVELEARELGRWLEVSR